MEVHERWSRGGECGGGREGLRGGVSRARGPGMAKREATKEGRELHCSTRPWITASTISRSARAIPFVRSSGVRVIGSFSEERNGTCTLQIARVRSVDRREIARQIPRNFRENIRLIHYPTIIRFNLDYRKLSVGSCEMFSKINIVFLSRRYVARLLQRYTLWTVRSSHKHENSYSLADINQCFCSISGSLRRLCWKWKISIRRRILSSKVPRPYSGRSAPAFSIRITSVLGVSFRRLERSRLFILPSRDITQSVLSRRVRVNE